MGDKVKALLAGDSIAGYYGPLVQNALGAAFEVSVITAPSKRTSRDFLANVREWMILPRYDIIHFNCGLHDIARARDSVGTAVPILEYERNLREVLRLLTSETSARVAWATTTPVIDERHAARKSFDRREQDVEEYNRTALRVVQEAGLAIDDLHAVVEAAGREECLSGAGVHMTDKGNRVLAEAVARFIRALTS